MNPRPADLRILSMPGLGTPAGVADYLWDHMLGEPEEPTLEQITEICEKIEGVVTIKLSRERAQDLWDAIDTEREHSLEREDEDEAQWNDIMTELANTIHAAMEESK